MRKFEASFLLVVFVLLTFRVFSGMHMHVLLRVLLVLLSIFYMWMGFFLFNKVKIADLFQKHQKRRFTGLEITLSIIGGIIYSLSIITIIHTLDFYRGMGSLIVFSFFVNAGILSFAAFLKRMNRAQYGFLKHFIIRSAVLSVLFLFLWIVPVEKRLTTLYKDHPGFVEAYKDYLDSPEDPEKLNRLREERSAFR